MKYMTLQLNWIWLLLSLRNQTYINHPITVGFQITSYAQEDDITLLDHNSPYMTEFYNYYVIGLYMTFTSNDIYDTYNKNQRPL